MRISDWSSDVCSSDLVRALPDGAQLCVGTRALPGSMLARMQIGDGALSFSDSDLCFRLAETVAFFSEFREDRKSDVSGTSVSVRVDLGGGRILKKKIKNREQQK